MLLVVVCGLSPLLLLLSRCRLPLWTSLLLNRVLSLGYAARSYQKVALMRRSKPSTSNTAASKSKDGMEDYNFAMKRMMRNPYEYHHDLGLNYALIITDNLIVGSQPQKPEDIDHLKKEEGVTYILNLQQDKDVEYWGSLHFSQFC